MPEIRPPSCGFFPDIPSSCWQFAFMLELNYEGWTSDSHLSQFSQSSQFSHYGQFTEMQKGECRMKKERIFLIFDFDHCPFLKVR